LQCPTWAGFWFSPAILISLKGKPRAKNHFFSIGQETNCFQKRKKKLMGIGYESVPNRTRPFFVPTYVYCQEVNRRYRVDNSLTKNFKRIGFVSKVGILHWNRFRPAT